MRATKKKLLDVVFFLLLKPFVNVDKTARKILIMAIFEEAASPLTSSDILLNPVMTSRPSLKNKVNG
jgi:hypothetical protein